MSDFNKHWFNFIPNTSLCVVKSSPLGGRGLFATRDINPGEIVFKDSPFLIGPRTGKNNLFCVSCYKAVEPRPCSKNCGLPVCCTNCEKSSVHLKECAFISSRQTTNTGKINLCLFRCLTPIRALLLNEDQQHFLKLFQAHAGLQHGFEVGVIKNNLQITVEEEDLLNRICSILDTNTFEVIVGDKEDDLSLRGMYPLSSMLNHNCVPNTVCYFDGSQNMIVKASSVIKENTEIFHSYTKIYWGTCVRQAYLLKTKHFACECLRCQDVTEFGTFLSAINCFQCKGLVLPVKKNAKTSWTCIDCKTVLADKIAGMVLAVLGSRLNSLLSANPIEILKFLNKDFVKYAPYCNQIAVQLKFRIVWLLGHCHDYFWTNLSTELLNEKEKICRELLKLLETLGAGSNKMRGLLLYELYSCLREKQRRKGNEEHLKTKEMKALLQESKEILKDDVHAPEEIKVCNNKELNLQ